MLVLYVFVIPEVLFFIDLIPEQSYTIYVSSENSITDQVPEEQFTSISSSVLVKTGNGILVKIHNVILPVIIIQLVKEACISLLAMLPVPPVQLTLSKFCH